MKKYKSTPVKKHPSGYAPKSESVISEPIETVASPVEPVVEASEPIQADQALLPKEETPVINPEPVQTLADLIDASSHTSEEPDTKAAEDPEPKHESSKPKRWGFQKKTNSTQPADKPEPQPEPTVQKENPLPMKTENSFSSVDTNDASAVISKQMSISGNIVLDSSLLLAGRVTGNIECKDDVQVLETGVVEGNLDVKSIRLTGGEIKGNIVCSGTLETDSETVINGDISADVIILRGKVTGQVTAAESVSLSSSAVVKGDLTSASISVEKGAVLEGKYSVSVQ